MIVFVLQFMVVTACDVAAIVFLGLKTWAIIAAVAVFVCGGLLFATREAVHEQLMCSSLITDIGVALFLGAAWPSLPFIVAWSGRAGA